jgi:hypothetical protein
VVVTLYILHGVQHHYLTTRHTYIIGPILTYTLQLCERRQLEFCSGYEDGTAGYTSMPGSALAYIYQRWKNVRECP